MAEKEKSTSVLSTLVTANHILHHHNVVDAYGHISVRNPSNAETFFMSGSLAPALVSSLADLVEYRVSDASAVQKDPPKGYAERFIHSEIYRKYPEVNSVVHAHSEAVIPFGLVNGGSGDLGPKLKPVFHMAGVLSPTGAPVPVFDIGSHYHSGDRQDLLITNQRLGAALAAEMTPSNLLVNVASAVKNYFGSSAPKAAAAFPACPVILMKQHGMTVCGHSVQEAVYRAIFTQTNARIQATSLMLQADVNQNKSTFARQKNQPLPAIDDISYLSADQCKGSWEAIQGHAERPWKLWCREVEVNPLYRNELGPPPGA